MEYTTNGGDHGNWYSIHGNIDQYFKAARTTLEKYMDQLRERKHDEDLAV